MNSGIYAITNTVNGKIYIGSTINFDARWEEHERTLRKGSHHNCYLQRSWNKYSEDVFEFGILEYLDNSDELVKAEQFWMDIYREEGKELYNIGEYADCSWRGQKWSEERYGLCESYKDRLGWSKGKNLSKEHCDNISEGLMGHVVSSETRQKISEANMGNQYALGCKRTEETKRKIGAANKGNKYCLGRVVSEETKQKMREAARNRPPVSEETRRKIGEANKRRIVSDETRRKMSVAQKGSKHSEESKRKISKAAMGNQRFLGHKHTEEARRKMSKASRAYWAKVKGSKDGSK